MESVNAKDRHGHTPLIAAAKEGQKDFVLDLLHRGADLTSTSTKGKTALHYAAANGHTEIVEMLIKKGSDVDARDDQHRGRRTPAEQSRVDHVQPDLRPDAPRPEQADRSVADAERFPVDRGKTVEIAVAAKDQPGTREDQHESAVDEFRPRAVQVGSRKL